MIDDLLNDEEYDDLEIYYADEISGIFDIDDMYSSYIYEEK